MSTNDEIMRVMDNVALDDEMSAGSRVESIEAIIKQDGWEAVRSVLFAILADEARRACWHTATAVLWGAILDKRPVTVDHAIARLYRCMELHPDTMDENLVWSVTAELKEVGYESDYDPLNDPGVIQEMGRLQG